MKLFERPKCFSEAIVLVTNFSCLLGLRIFEYPRGHPRPILSLIYFLFVFGIYYGGSFNIEKKYYSNVRLMKLEYFLYKIMSYIVAASVILKMLLGWWHTKKFKICYKKIFKIDETLRQLGLPVNYDRIYFGTIGMMTVWITASFTLSTIAFIHLKIRTDIFTSVYIILLVTYSITVNFINIYEFCMFVRCLQIKFKLINQFLCENLINLSTNKIKLGIFELKDYAKIMDVEQRKHIFSSMIQVHLELCKVSKIVCTILGVQVAWEIGSIITYLSGAFYYLLARYVMHQHEIIGVVEQTTLTLSLSLLHIFRAVFMSLICKNAADEGNKTIEIIHAIYGCDADTDMQEEIQQFGIQILQSPVTFSVFGLTLDHRVLTMILKSVTIYVVIMVQVSITLESDDSVQYRQF
ncbi:hypothetical protein ALC57_01721 [Trachymyrmex cornetzi]|uniref:Gustatory receptor n=1 Tax=Trachymyrmex cornetzi TaxID=471704 RepID=A0A195EKJ1_9HYME|nr:hypothetical protein ALC57_01721 [Trachymyrmex cornetzi]